MSRRTDRKGQVTLFVLLGVALLILILVFLFLKPRTQQQLPSDFQAVQDRIQGCLRDTTVDALQLMASHGGYLDPLDANDTGRQLVLDPQHPTASDLLRLNPSDNESAVPYYYYLAGSNTCQLCLLTTLTPTKEHMEQDAEKYVLAHLHQCFAFDQLPNYQVTEGAKETLTITLDNESVEIEYDHPFTIARGQQSAKQSVFTQQLPLPYLRYYEAAVAITQKEIDTQFLENYLMYLVSAYSGLDQQLPPLAGYEESFTPHLWILYNVQQEYRQLLYSTTPSLQVMGTEGWTPPPAVNDTYVQGFLKTMQLDLLNGTNLGQQRFRVSFLSPDMPIYLDVNPRAGQVIRPRTESQGGIFLIPARQQNYYDFYYDISAPFIIEIRQENALPGRDFSFLFALEGNVRENKNMAQWLLGQGTIPWSYDFVKYKITDPASGLPANETPAAEPYQHNDSLTTLLCDPTQAVVPVTAKVFDGRTGQPLPNVTFSYSCGLYATCDVGQSAPDAQNIYDRLDAELPQCIGGILTAEKAGYSTQSVRISTREGSPVAVPDLSLDPYVTKTVRVVKEPLTIKASGYGFDLGEEKLLDQNDTVIITFTRQPQGAGDSPVSATALFDNGTNTSDVSLIPGLYEVKATYIDAKGRTILKGCESVHGQDLPDKDVVVKPAPWGGLDLSNSTHYWQVQRDQLYADNVLVVPIFVAPPPRCLDDLDFMSDQVMFTRSFPDKADPRFEPS